MDHQTRIAVVLSGLFQTNPLGSNRQLATSTSQLQQSAVQRAVILASYTAADEPGLGGNVTRPAQHRGRVTAEFLREQHQHALGARWPHRRWLGMYDAYGSYYYTSRFNSNFFSPSILTRRDTEPGVH